MSNNISTRSKKSEIPPKDTVEPSPGDLEGKEPEQELHTQPATNIQSNPILPTTPLDLDTLSKVMSNAFAEMARSTALMIETLRQASIAQHQDSVNLANMMSEGFQSIKSNSKSANDVQMNNERDPEPQEAEEAEFDDDYNPNQQQNSTNTKSSNEFKPNSKNSSATDHNVSTAQPESTKTNKHVGRPPDKPEQHSAKSAGRQQFDEPQREPHAKSTAYHDNPHTPEANREPPDDIGDPLEESNSSPGVGQWYKMHKGRLSVDNNDVMRSTHIW